MTTNRHERRKIHTRAALMEAALDCVLDKGYEATSVQDITDRADLGRGTFYIHFQDKEDAVWTAIREGLDKAHDEGAAAPVPPDLPKELQYYMNVFAYAEKHRDLFKIMLGNKGSASITAKAQEYLLSDLLKADAAHWVHSEPGVPTEVWAQILMGAFFRLLVWWLESPGRYSARQAAEMLYGTLHPAART